MRFDVILELLGARADLLASVAPAHEQDVHHTTSLGNGVSTTRINSMEGLRAFLGGGL